MCYIYRENVHQSLRDEHLECNTLQHRKTLQHAATVYDICTENLQLSISVMRDTLVECNTLQHTATHRSTMQHAATRCNTLQHVATVRDIYRENVYQSICVMSDAHLECRSVASPCLCVCVRERECVCV